MRQYGAYPEDQTGQILRAPNASNPSRQKASTTKCTKLVLGSAVSRIWYGSNGGDLFNVIDVFKQWRTLVLAGWATRRETIMVMNDVLTANSVLPA